MNSFPLPFVSGRATSVRLAISRSTNKLKSVAAELNLNNSLVVKYDGSVEAMQGTLIEAKRKYFEQKRLEKLGDLALAADLLNSIHQG